MSPDHFSSLDDLFVTSIFLAEPYIVLDIHREQERILEHGAHVGAERSSADVLKILTVDQYSPAHGVIETLQQVNDRTFTSTDGTDNGQFFRALQTEIDILMN